MSSFFNLQILNKKKLSHRFQKILPPFRYQKFTEHKTLYDMLNFKRILKINLKISTRFRKTFDKDHVKTEKMKPNRICQTSIFNGLFVVTKTFV